MVLPAALDYHSRLAEGAAAAKAAGFAATPQKESAERIAHLCDLLTQRKKSLVELFDKAEALDGEDAKAHALAHDVSRAMVEVRNVCDELEGIVADDLWPLPKYREMLFLS
jgi:glutamine synthetase